MTKFDREQLPTAEVTRDPVVESETAGILGDLDDAGDDDGALNPAEIEDLADDCD